MSLFNTCGLNRRINALSFKQILVSICLLFVLVSGITIQAVGQPELPSTISVTVCPGDDLEHLLVLIDELPLCIQLSEPPSYGLGIQLVGDVYFGSCDDPVDLIGKFNSTILFESGAIILNFTLESFEILYAEAKFIDNEDFECEYAFVEIYGERIDLFLIGVEENEPPCLPTFIFSIGKPSPRHDLNSIQDNGATSNKGTITINGTETHSLPDYDYFWAEVEHQITYAPEEGYAFVRWETGGTSEVDDPNSQTTTLTTHDESGSLTAVYREISKPVGSQPVGGYATSVEKSAIIAPYIALIGLIGAISTIFAIRRWLKS